MPRRRAFALVALVALSGCVTQPNPDPTIRLDTTGVEVLPLAPIGAFGGTLEVAWKVHDPVGAKVQETWIGFGPVARPDAGNLSAASYPFRATAPEAGPDGTRAALVTLNLSIVHIRAYARIGGEDWWSKEARVVVQGAPFGDPEARLAIPRAVEAGLAVPAEWGIRNATGGIAELTVTPGRPGGSSPLQGAFRIEPSLNGSSGVYVRNVTFPFPGTWTVVAALNLSGSILATNSTEVRVREPASPNVAFIAPLREAAPGERIAVRFRANGNGALGGADVVAGSEAVAAQAVGGRNFTASVFAPARGPLVLRARVVVGGVAIESDPLVVAVRAQGPWAVTLLSYPTEAAPTTPIVVAFRVAGPATSASFVGVHSGNQSADAPPNALSPSNYTSTSVADGQTGDGSWGLPADFHANFTAPPQPGVVWLRARVVVAGVAYWSQEGSVVVRA